MTQQTAWVSSKPGLLAGKGGPGNRVGWGKRPPSPLPSSTPAERVGHLAIAHGDGRVSCSVLSCMDSCALPTCKGSTHSQHRFLPFYR